MKYRIELDALHALIDEQKKTNELLSELLSKVTEETVQKPQEIVKTDKRQYQRRKAQ